MNRLIECVPNFSEGRDPAKVDAIVAAMSGVPGVYVLDREMDADHNRCVITLVGDPDAVADAALLGVGKAAELIDLTCHQGAHPRIGATDVVPFIPVEGQVDQLSCLADAEQSRVRHGIGIADQCDDATVVVGVHFAVEHVYAGHAAHSRDDSIDFCGIAPFRKIWDALDQSIHSWLARAELSMPSRLSSGNK